MRSGMLKSSDFIKRRSLLSLSFLEASGRNFFDDTFSDWSAYFHSSIRGGFDGE
jgi:hypothetical protein